MKGGKMPLPKGTSGSRHSQQKCCTHLQGFRVQGT